ncbi:MAG TPA: 30S ribosomal protein S2 [Gaiellaceae bacterium]|nr:30S ribosomal protein S2 [Gaiellaceae bacterium]
MSVVTMRELLEAGVHFGHQTRRWNPKMRRYIFGERGGIYIIDLTKTLELLEESYQFVRNVADRGGTILFVGTKKQAQDAVSEHAQRVGMPYVNNRWLGGLLTNWRTISERIAYLHDLRRLKADGQLELLPSKERIAMEADLEKLEANLGGVADMKRQPDAVFVIDMKKEQLAVRETQRLGVPVIGLVDTNADPDEANFVIPGNDDAIRSCNLVTRVIADGIAAGKTKVTPAELTAEPAPPAEEIEEPAVEPELEPAAVAAEGGESR